MLFLLIACLSLILYIGGFLTDLNNTKWKFRIIHSLDELYNKLIIAKDDLDCFWRLLKPYSKTQNTHIIILLKMQIYVHFSSLK
jgi:hypothetical protein